MRGRLLRSMISVTVLAVVVFALPLGVVVARLYRSRAVSRLERRATIAAGALPAVGPRREGRVDPPAVGAHVRLAVYDGSGRLVQGAGPAQADAVVAAALQGRVFDDHDGAWLAVAVPVRDGGAVVGAARAAVAWDSVRDATEQSWLVVGTFGAAAVALAGAAAAWQSSRLAAPVKVLADRAAALGHGDFTSRVAPSQVPELDQAADALNHTAARLGDLLGRERAFAADVSHQLATPLTSLRLALEGTLASPGSDPAPALEQAVAEVDRLQATIATLLALARDDLSPTEVSEVAPACEAVTSRFGPPLAAVGRSLVVDLGPDLQPVRCSAEVLGEILAVLVDNAQVHGAGAVTVAARIAGRGVVVDVGDEGPGIAGDPGRVFRRRSPEATGHGIGLALARSLAEAHGARLELTRVGPRPVFSIALPGAPRGRVQV